MDASSTSSLKPSAVDRAVRDVMSRPLSPEELSGFGPAKRKAPSAWPVASVKRGRDGRPVVEVGVKGVF